MAKLHGWITVAMGAVLGLACGCVPPGTFPTAGAPQPEPAKVASVIDERLRPAPEVFSATARAKWDGALTLQGLWIAHPQAKEARRVRITSLLTGTAVDGALFRRDAGLAGPSVLISSELAQALGMTPGVEAEVSIVAVTLPEATAAGGGTGVDTSGVTAQPIAPLTATAATPAVVSEDTPAASATVPAPVPRPETAAASAPEAAPVPPAAATAPADPEPQVAKVDTPPAEARGSQQPAPAPAQAAPPPQPVAVPEPAPEKPATAAAQPEPPARPATSPILDLSVPLPEETAKPAPEPTPAVAAKPNPAPAPAPTATPDPVVAAKPQPPAPTSPTLDLSVPLPEDRTATTDPVPPKPAATGLSDGLRFIQAGSFGVADNATSLVDRLNKAGLNAQARGGGTGLTRVLVGPFDNRAARDAALAEIRRLGLKDASLVKG